MTTPQSSSILLPHLPTFHSAPLKVNVHPYVVCLHGPSKESAQGTSFRTHRPASPILLNLTRNGRPNISGWREHVYSGRMPPPSTLDANHLIICGAEARQNARASDYDYQSNQKLCKHTPPTTTQTTLRGNAIHILYGHRYVTPTLADCNKKSTRLRVAVQRMHRTL